MTDLLSREPHDLESLAVLIRYEVGAVEANIKSAVAHAVRAGELLIEAKAQVRHGEWLPWLEQNFPATRKTAAAYMRMADPANVTRVSHLDSVREAVALLAAPRQDEAPSEAAETDGGGFVPKDPPREAESRPRPEPQERVLHGGGDPDGDHHHEHVHHQEHLPQHDPEPSSSELEVRRAEKYGVRVHLLAASRALSDALTNAGNDIGEDRDELREILDRLSESVAALKAALQPEALW